MKKRKLQGLTQIISFHNAFKNTSTGDIEIKYTTVDWYEFKEYYIVHYQQVFNTDDIKLFKPTLNFNGTKITNYNDYYM